MTSPGSEAAWQFSSFGTESDDNQRMGCSSVPSAWLAKVPERILQKKKSNSTVFSSRLKHLGIFGLNFLAL